MIGRKKEYIDRKNFRMILDIIRKGIFLWMIKRE